MHDGPNNCVLKLGFQNGGVGLGGSVLNNQCSVLIACSRVCRARVQEADGFGLLAE